MSKSLKYYACQTGKLVIGILAIAIFLLFLGLIEYVIDTYITAKLIVAIIGIAVFLFFSYVAGDEIFKSLEVCKIFK
jgi:hypothetical protein